MNPSDPQLWLRIRRPGGQDDADPAVAEALAAARSDPKRAAELRREEEADTAISRALHDSTEPPPDLLPRLLALGGSRVIRTPWFQTAPARMLRWAACVALLAALAAWWLQPRREPARFAAFRQQMIQTLERAEGPLDLESPDLQEIRRWLAARQAPDHLPAGSRLGETAPLGCRLLRWQGRPVALICFRLDGGRRAHLLVAATDAFADPPPAEPTLARQDSWTTAAWSRGDWAYLLAGRDVSPEELQRLL